MQTDFETIARQQCSSSCLRPPHALRLRGPGSRRDASAQPQGIVAWRRLREWPAIRLSLDAVRRHVSKDPRTAFYDMIVLDSYQSCSSPVFLIAPRCDPPLIKYLDIEGEQRGEYYS